MSIRGQRIEVHGLTFNVYAAGAGEPVMLLHGFPDSNSVWRSVIPNLVDNGYRVIAPDQRGFGESDAPEGIAHYHIELIAADAVAILNELGITRSRLVGHDWGATIGWVLAGTNPERFESLVAVSVGHPNASTYAGFGGKKKGWVSHLLQPCGIAEKALVANDCAIFREIVNYHPETERWIRDLSRPGRLTAAMDWHRANLSRLWRGEFPRLSIPTFGIWSTGDDLVAEDQMVGSAVYVDASWQYQRIKDASHWIPLDLPDHLSELILSYFER